MGISASYNLKLLQAGVSNREEISKYTQLLKEVKEKFGNNFTPELDKICGILAKDPNATVEDVELMYNQIKQEGIAGKNGTSNLQKLNSFHTTLKMIPEYKNIKLTSENIRDLLKIYNTCYKAPRDGMTGEATFFAEATKYIEDLNKKEIDLNIEKDNRIEINKNIKKVGFEYYADLNKLMINRSK